MNTEFKMVPGFSRYSISRDGQVLSHTRKKSKFLKGSLQTKGYMKFNLKNDNDKRVKIYLHQLIALAYLDYQLPGSTAGLIVDHKDDNATNNCLENIQIITQRENIAKRFKNKELPANVYTYKLKNTIKYIVRVGKGRIKKSAFRHTVGIFNTIDEAVQARNLYLEATGEPYKSNKL